MRVPLLFPLMVSLLFGGCANPPQQFRYAKYGATQEEFMKDRYACLQEAQQRVSGAYVDAYGGGSASRVVANCGVWLSCMGARGYQVDPDGNLAAPPAMIVFCQR